MNYRNYYTEIETTFIRRRGKHLLLSSLDIGLIASWQEKGIPLRIVLRAIEDVFDAVDNSPNRKRTIKTLSYCEDEVEAQYHHWLETRVGNVSEKKTEKVKNEDITEKEPTSGNDSELFSEETIKMHLESVGKSVDLAKGNISGELSLVLEEVSLKISEYRNIKINAESLEESLNHLEEMIDEALLRTADQNKLSAVKKEIEKELAGHRSKMEQDAYQRTFDLMLLKKLREDAELPRLSLFYL